MSLTYLNASSAVVPRMEVLHGAPRKGRTAITFIVDEVI